MTVRTGTKALGVLVVAMALLGAACGGSNTPTATTPPATTSPPPAAQGTTLSQVDFQFSPSTLTVAQGATVTVKNNSTSVPHTFTVTGQGIDITNDAGQSQDVTISLPPGTYPFICRFHESQGMTGTLVVQ